MSNLNDNIRRIFSSKKITPTAVPPIDLASFNSFLHQQAQWIKEHVEYERDMEHNLNKDNKVLVRFDIGQYVTNFDNYFKEQGLYQHKIEDVFFILMTLLAPTEDVAALLSKENRKKLFAGILVNLSLNTGIKLADLIKTYYGKINSLAEKMTTQPKDSILELYKESIELVDKHYDQITEKESSPEIRSPQVKAPDLLTEVLKSFSIHNRSNLIKMLTRANVVGFGFTMLVYSFIIILLLIYYQEVDHTLAGLIQMQSVALITQSIIAVIILVAVANIVTYTRARLKKKFLLRTLRTVIRYFNISHNVVDTYFRGKFQFDIRKLR